MAKKFKTIRPQYMVLTGNMITDEQREKLEEVSRTLGTGRDAAVYAASHEGWGYLPVSASTVGSSMIGILRFNGTDVALYFQRQFVRIQTHAEDVLDAAPAKRLLNEDDAWMRISLLETKSSKLQAQQVLAELTKVKQELDVKNNLIAAQRRELDMTNEECWKLKLAAGKVKV